MSRARNTGRVISVDRKSEPASNRPSWRIWVDVPEKEQEFYIPLDGPCPEIGDVVCWGPHHWWNDAKGQRGRKSYMRDPNAPLR